MQAFLGEITSVQGVGYGLPEAEDEEDKKKESSLALADMPNYVKIDEEQLGVYLNRGLELKKMVAQAVDAAIQEIIPPVIARSVTIALVTTRELTVKDFALEPDDRKFMKGAQHMIQNLAGSLALVTCREPLRLNIINQLRKMLEEQTITPLQEEDITKINNSVSYDNLNLGCALIKQAVIQKALEDITQEAQITQAIEKRKAAKA